MKRFIRRDFIKIAAVQGAATLLAPKLSFARGAWAPENLIGSTGILWGYGPDDIEPALRDINRLGFHGFETFGNVIETWEEKRGGFGPIIERHGVPLISAFCSVDVVNPANLKGDLEKLIKWAQLLKKNGGKLVEFCAVGANRRNNVYNYKEHKKDLINAMDTYAKAVTDLGLTCALHPHTGTAIETRDETYFAMENVNTTYMKFGPDVGQLQKGGADPVPIVRDFLSLIHHVHLKDYKGGLDNGWLGYSPLGEGEVKLKEILKMLETRQGKMNGMIMFELDCDNRRPAPLTPFQAARTSKEYLEKLGYSFINHPRTR